MSSTPHLPLCLSIDVPILDLPLPIPKTLKKSLVFTLSWTISLRSNNPFDHFRWIAGSNSLWSLVLNYLFSLLKKIQSLFIFCIVTFIYVSFQYKFVGSIYIYSEFRFGFCVFECVDLDLVLFFWRLTLVEDKRGIFIFWDWIGLIKTWHLMCLQGHLDNHHRLVITQIISKTRIFYPIIFRIWISIGPLPCRIQLLGLRHLANHRHFPPQLLHHNFPGLVHHLLVLSLDL